MNKLYIAPVILVTILIGLMFFEKEEIHVIISEPVVTSSVESSDLETLSYSVLTNMPDRYEFNVDYVIKGEIITKERFLPIQLTDILKTNLEKEIDGDIFTLVIFEYKPLVMIEDGIIQYESADIVIHYENNKELTFPLGEFNFAFYRDTDDLSLGSLKATTERIKEIDSLGGIYLELGNQTENEIIINNIEVFSQSIVSNQDAIIKYDGEINYKDKVVDVLQTGTYDFFHETRDTQLNYCIRSKDNIELYVPLLYLGDIYHVGRLSIIVTYTINGETKVKFIDDFPFMRYDIYNDLLKDNWVIMNGN